LDRNKPYRIKLDGTGKMKISDDMVSNLNVSGGWIYFTNESDGNNIYKIRTDGTDRIKLNDDYSCVTTGMDISGINVVGDWIYYKNGIDNYRLYRIKNDGTGRQLFGEDTTIARIDNINDAAVEGSGYTLPSSIVAIMGDGYLKNVPIVWNLPEVDTSSKGTYYIEGTVEGYSSKVTLTLEVVESEEYGNTSGNMNNNLYTAEYQGWIYYVNRSDNNNIYKVKADGTGRTKLNSMSSWSPNVAGGWVYFYSNNSIYKMGTDGSSCSKIVDGTSRMLVVGDWIYYMEDINPGIFKVMTDGTNKTRITTVNPTAFYVYGGWIYYASQNENHKLYKVKTDGTGNVKLSDDSAYCMNLADGYIYYYNGYLNRVNTIGSDKVILSNSCSGNINVSDGWVYYTDNYQLYKIRIDGSGKTLLYDSAVTSINVSGGWIYFNIIYYQAIYQMKIDGTELQPMIQ
jgi:hypothetical protein